MKKIILLSVFFVVMIACQGFAQFASDGSYLWNSTSITYSVNDKTELILANKDHYSNQINHMDYFHFDLTAYRKMSKDFSIGLGVRQTESYKLEHWNPGNTFLLYGVFLLNPGNIKIKFANRVTSKVSKIVDTQYGLDNITNVDFFTHSTSKFPKPFLMDELFSNLNQGKVQTVRIYGGFHLLKLQNLAFDLYYCYQKTRPTWEWKEYNVFGISTKLSI